MIKPITTVKVTGRRVIVRVGFDVALTQGEGGRGKGTAQEFEVLDDTRIKDCLPTLKYLIDQKAKIVLMSHLGRPQGFDQTKSLKPVAEKLAELLNFKFVEISDRLPQYPVPHVYFLAADITKSDESDWSKKIPAGQILFLENLRFYPAEQKNDEGFAQTLAKFGDVYVDEAFSNAHRQDASMVSLPRLLPAYAGISLAHEIESLHKVVYNPVQPLVLIIGGAKIEDKEQMVEYLAPKASHILLGGATANTFLKAAGYEVGKSKISNVALAKKLLRNYKDKIVLPVDAVVAENAQARARVVNSTGVKPDDLIFDIGPATITKFSAIIKQAKTLVWNGPLGMFENPKFAMGSKALAQAFASRSKGPAYGVIGGGETVLLFDQAVLTEFVDHVSTGGGAMLEFLAGKQLPAIKALDKK